MYNLEQKLMQRMHPYIRFQQVFGLAPPQPHAMCFGTPHCNAYASTKYLAGILREGLEPLCHTCGQRTIVVSLRTYSVEDIETRTLYFTRDQVLEILKGCRNLWTPEELGMWFNRPTLAAIRFHFGMIRKAYAAIDRKYTLPEVANWKERVKEFLGNIPDTLIAEKLGVSKSAVTRLRRESGIPAVRGYKHFSPE